MKDNTTNLTTPNDPSPGQCYAPIDKNGNVIIKKKKHFNEGNHPPLNWKQVQCSLDCQGKR